MAATVARLNIHLGANLAQLQKDFKGATGIVQGAARGMMGAWTAAIGAIGAGGGVAGFLGFGVKLAADMEVARKSFAVLAGDAQRGRALLDELWTFAAETPFEFDELQRAGRLLLGYGMQAEEVTGWLRRLGDISAAIQQPIGELADLFGRNSQQGRFYTRDLNEFASRGIPIIKELAKQFGVAESQIRGMAEAGEIGFADVQLALENMTSQGGLFFNLMQEQANTLSGRWAKLVDDGKMLAMTIGEQLLPAAAGLVSWGSSIISALQEWASNFGEVQVKAAAMATAFLVVVTIGPSIVKAISSIISALRALAIAQATSQAFSGWQGIAALAAGAAAAAGAYYAIDSAIASVNDTMTEAQATASAASAAAQENARRTNEERKALYEQARAAQAASAAHEKLMSRGKSIESELRTPMEKYIDTMRELQELLHAAAISQEMFARGASKAADELFKSVDAQKELRDLERKPVSAVTRFTMQGFSAASAGQNEAAKLAEVQKLAREGDQRREALLRQAVELLKQKPPENPKPVRI